MTTALTESPTTTRALKWIPLAQLHESKDNPRKKYDENDLRETARSLKLRQMTPCKVRPHPTIKDGFEIAAGHRRRRAAALPEAGPLKGLWCEIEEMDDRTFLEILNSENPHHKPLHELEEAQGYVELMKCSAASGAGKQTAATIAERVGLSEKYVYDRIKLLSLTPEAQELFLEGRFTASHAILIARRTAEDQKRIIKEVLFEREDLELVRNWGPDASKKCVSVNELEDWIARHIRVELQELRLFPDTALAVKAAEDKRETIISITHQHHLARHDDKKQPPIYAPGHWQYADGAEHFNEAVNRKVKSKTCEKACTGVFAIGSERGRSARVCIDVECAVHHPKPKAPPKAKRHTASKADIADRKRQEKAAARRRAEEAKTEERKQQWKIALPVVRDAFTAKIKAAPIGSIIKLVGNRVEEQSGVDLRDAEIGAGKSADAFLRHVASAFAVHALDNEWAGPREGPDMAKALGFKLPAVISEAVKKNAAAANGAKATNGTKAAKKSKRAKGKK